MKQSTKHILLHIAGWIFFLLTTVLILNDPNEGLLKLFLDGGVTAMIIATLLLMGVFFYVNRFFLVPDLFFQRKYFLYASSVFLFVVVIMALPLVMRIIFGSFDLQPGQHLINHLLSTALLFMMVFVVSTSAPVIKRWVDAENSAIELENQRLSAELSFLKSQVNPHFLFNTLNNIYALSVNHDPVASESILKLSQLLRYLLQEAQSESVSINKEIEHLKQYIDLQKLRLTKMVAVDFEVSTDSSAFNIAPLLLLPFVENAFKYGISAHQASKIEISLRFKESVFEFSVKNSMNSGALAEVISTGIGVENVRKRLELSYPGNFELEIKNSGQSHQVNLKITGLC